MLVGSTECYHPKLLIGEESIPGKIDHSRSWKIYIVVYISGFFLKILKLFKKYSTRITVIICLCSLHERDKSNLRAQTAVSLNRFRVAMGSIQSTEIQCLSIS